LANSSETPLMKQYHQIKAKYPGALLLFRVGDFYETFGEDAIKASKILSITLTKRANGAASHVELAGFPHHSIDNYLPKLVRAGQRVAICDQLENPKDVKGIVKRGVTELVTPGVSYNDNVLDVKRNNYLASVFIGKKNQLGLAFLDISTGEFLTAQGSVPYIDKLMQGFMPSEVLYCKPQKEEIDAIFGDAFNTFKLDDWVFAYDYAHEQLVKHFGTAGLKGFGVEELDLGITAAGAILHYLNDTEHREQDHITSISRIEEDRFVWLDKFTIRNLELVYPQHENGTPLIDILDHTQTPMGSRLMRKWLVLPLKNITQIQERLDFVDSFIADEGLANILNEHSKHIGDLERLISKVAAKRINPRELAQLRKALDHIAPIKEQLALSKNTKHQLLADKINLCQVLRDKIKAELQDELPMVTNQGGMIKDGVDLELDELRDISNGGKDKLLQIQIRESEKSGIKLKIAYNKVFGYYIEVSNSQKDKVPVDWIRKQTLVNAERYITEELKIYEDKILNAEGSINAIEFRIFTDLVQVASEYVNQIQENARLIGQVDCLLSFATTAITNQYCKPRINDGTALEIKAGRHPVIEKKLPFGVPYIPNDIYLDNDEQQIVVITGPNMAGKSALLRQTALIVLMAQMGSYVPAQEANLGIIDKVFTRVGASDNLSQGESTFMVEMTETASILNNLSDRSLVLMDEIGRGTSTYDGVSIAWSIVEFLHNHPKSRAKTLFATHYHELNQLTEDFPRIKNFNVSVKESNNKIIFMRTLKPGGSEHSFGIHVAQLAGMPNPVLLRAGEILQHLEKDKRKADHKQKIADLPKNNYQLSLFEADPKFSKLQEMLGAIDINTMSPVEALLKLNELKKVL
jgi:DNA mismatch repair protein MutS